MKKILLLFCFIYSLVGYGQDCLTPVDFGADTSLRDFFLNTNNYTAGYIQDINGNMAINDLVRNGTVCAELAQNVTLLNLSGSQNNDVGGILQPGDNPEVAAPGLNITSMEGISAFTGLLYLYAINNNYTTIDLTSSTALIDFRGYDGNGGNDGPLQTVNLRGLNNLEVVGLDNNMITELMLEGNSSLRILDARNNQLAALNLTDVVALDRTGLVNNPMTCIQVANQITADNYNANPGTYQKDAGDSFGINCIYDIEISLGPQLLDLNGFYVINNGNLDPTLSFDALNSGGMQVTAAELANYDLIINTLESTTLNPANGGPAPIVRGDGSDFTLITDQDITVPVINSGIDDTFSVVIEGDDLFEADEFFVIEVSTADPSINLSNADPDGVVRFNMRVDDTNDTATASLEKLLDGDGIEGQQDIQYRISMSKTNDTRQDLVFGISITDIDTDAGDYTNVTQAIIPDGADEVVFSIPVTADAVAEPVESLQTTLSYTGLFASRLTVTQPGPITATITDNTQCTNAVNFTDPNLRAFFLELTNYSSGFIRGASGNLTINDLVINGEVCVEKANQVTFLNLSNGAAEPFNTNSNNPGIGVTSLDGIENFINLEFLYAQNNPITRIDLRANIQLRDFRAFNGLGGQGVLEYVDLRGLSILEVAGLGNNVINQLLLEDNTSLRVLHAENNSLTGNLDISTFENTLVGTNPGPSSNTLRLTGNQLSCIRVSDLTNAQTKLANSDWLVDDINIVRTSCEEPMVTITANDPDASEVGPDNGQFTITLSEPVPPGCCPLTINYTVGGTALTGEDYTSLTETVQIPIGGNSATIDVDVLNNDDANDTETVVVTLEVGSDYTVGTPNSDTVTITNNTENADVPIATITANDPNASEIGPDNGQFTITLSEPVPPGCCPLTINYTVGGTAILGADYTTLTGTVQIPIGGNSATIDVNVLDNDNTNDTETVFVTLEVGSDYTVGTPNSDTVTIANSGETIGSDDILVVVTSETCEGKNNGEILVSVSNEDYVFNVLLDGDIVGQASVGSPLTIENQENGEYIVCLTISELPSFEQCFGININSAQPLNVLGDGVNFVNLTASYLVEGSKSYEVFVNDSRHTFNFNSTSSRSIEVPLDSGENEIIITGISDCQGIFKEAINLQNSIIAFPNPVTDHLNVLGISSNENMKIELFSLAGQRLKSFSIQNNASNSINLPMFDLPIGVYLVRGQTNNENKFELKIVKK